MSLFSTIVKFHFSCFCILNSLQFFRSYCCDVFLFSNCWLISFVIVLFILFVSFISFVFLFNFVENCSMMSTDQIRRPSKTEQKMAIESLPALSSILSNIHSEQTEIEIEETGERIKIPARALVFLGDILKAMGEGKPVSIVPVATEVTTQKAAEILGCSRPYLVKLLEEGAIEFIKVGKHRRIKFEDVVAYREKMEAQQKNDIIDIMCADEELGLYDS